MISLSAIDTRLVFRVLSKMGFPKLILDAMANGVNFLSYKVHRYKNQKIIKSESSVSYPYEF